MHQSSSSLKTELKMRNQKIDRLHLSYKIQIQTKENMLMDQKYQVFCCPCISITNLWGRLTILQHGVGVSLGITLWVNFQWPYISLKNFMALKIWQLSIFLVYVYSSKVDDFILAKSQQIKLTYDDGDDMDNMLNGTA